MGEVDEGIEVDVSGASKTGVRPRRKANILDFCRSKLGLEGCKGPIWWPCLICCRRWPCRPCVLSSTGGEGLAQLMGAFASICSTTARLSGVRTLSSLFFTSAAISLRILLSILRCG